MTENIATEKLYELLLDILDLCAIYYDKNNYEYLKCLYSVTKAKV